MDIVDRVFEGLSLHDNADQTRKAMVKQREEEQKKRKRRRWSLAGVSLLAIFSLIFSAATLFNLKPDNNTVADSDITVDFSKNSSDQEADDQDDQNDQGDQDDQKDHENNTESQPAANNNVDQSQNETGEKKKSTVKNSKISSTKNTQAATSQSATPESTSTPRQTAKRTTDRQKNADSSSLFYDETTWLCYSGQTTTGCNGAYPYLGPNNALTQEKAMRKAWATYTENGAISDDGQTFEEWKVAGNYSCSYHEVGYFKYWTCQ